MGIELVKVALSTQYAALSDSARLVLVIMASTALDRPKGGVPARRYWAGHDSIILILTGASPGEAGYRAGQVRVTRAIGTLVKAGAITRLHRGHRGKQAEYELLPEDYSPRSPPDP